MAPISKAIARLQPVIGCLLDIHYKYEILISLLEPIAIRKLCALRRESFIFRVDPCDQNAAQNLIYKKKGKKIRYLSVTILFILRKVLL